MDRREFLKNTFAATAGLLTGGPGTLNAAGASSAQRQHIHVNVPSYQVELYDEYNELESTYDCRIGTPDTPTPIGEGIVTQKYDTPRFKDEDGDVIETVELEPLDMEKEIPYEDMRSLFTQWWSPLAGEYRMTGKIMHPTEQYWTIGYPFSDGCVVLDTDDMLDLYNRVDYPLPTVEHTYDTILADEEGSVTVWVDVYDQGTTNASQLIEATGRPDTYSLRHIIDNLQTIDSWLDIAYQQVQDVLARGEDPEHYDIEVSFTINQEQLLLSEVSPTEKVPFKSGNDQLFMSSSTTR